MSLVHSSSEVLVVGQELFEVDYVFIKEGTSDNWSEFVAEDPLDGFVNVVSNKSPSLVTLEFVKIGDINLWQV